MLRGELKAAAERMLAEFERTREVRHTGVKGRARETIVFEEFLGKYLPDRHRVSGAVVISSDGDQSRQQDLVVYDAGSAPVLRASDIDRLLFVESILASFEIKSRLTKSELDDILVKSASLWSLPQTSRDHAVLVPGIQLKTQQLPIQCFGLAFESSLTLADTAGELAERRKLMPHGNALSVMTILRDKDGNAGLLVNADAANLRSVLTTAVTDTRVAKMACESPGDALLVTYLMLMEHLAAAGTMRPGPDLMAYLRGESFGLPSHTVSREEQAGAIAVLDGQAVHMDSVQRLMELGTALREDSLKDGEIVEFVYLIGESPARPIFTHPDAVFVEEGITLDTISPSEMHAKATDYLHDDSIGLPEDVINFVKEMTAGGRRVQVVVPSAGESMTIQF